MKYIVFGIHVVGTNNNNNEVDEIPVHLFNIEGSVIECKTQLENRLGIELDDTLFEEYGNNASSHELIAMDYEVNDLEVPEGAATNNENAVVKKVLIIRVPPAGIEYEQIAAAPAPVPNNNENVPSEPMNMPIEPHNGGRRRTRRRKNKRRANTRRRR
jgi:hypothetical protein